MKTAADAFMRNYTDIGNALATIQAIHDEHFYVDPEKLNWGDVGELNHVSNKLNEIIEFISGTLRKGT